MNRYIFTAAGDGKRWGNHCGVRKHLAPICGEPNLFRTIRLIQENDKSAEFYIGIHPDYPINHLNITTYDGTTYKMGAESDRYIVSKPYWNENGRTILIWADTFFTENAVKILCQSYPYWVRYGREGGNKFKSYGEEFGLSFWPEHHNLMYESSKKIEEISLRRGIDLYGTIYLAMLGMPEDEIIKHSNSGRKPNFGNMIEINDETDDFDFPEDYNNFIERWLHI